MNLEKIEKRYNMLFILGVIIFFGGTLFVKVTGMDHLVGFIGGAGGGLIGLSAIALYKIKKKPEDYKDEVINHSDERGIAIRGYATMVTMLGAIFILSVVAIFLDYDFLLLIGAGVMVILLVSFSIFTRYYERKI